MINALELLGAVLVKSIGPTLLMAVVSVSAYATVTGIRKAFRRVVGR
jgi:hypothetical protein